MYSVGYMNVMQLLIHRLHITFTQCMLPVPVPCFVWLPCLRHSYSVSCLCLGCYLLYNTAVSWSDCVHRLYTWSDGRHFAWRTALNIIYSKQFFVQYFPEMYLIYCIFWVLGNDSPLLLSAYSCLYVILSLIFVFVFKVGYLLNCSKPWYRIGMQ